MTSFFMAEQWSPAGLYAAQESDGESFKVCDSLYECLVRFETGTTEIIPGLATRWESSEDGKIWTFFLQENVPFHCGRPMDAEAVAYSFERQWSKRDPLHEDHDVGGPYIYWSSLGIDDYLEDIVVLDPLTIQFRLSEPHAPFLSNLACAFSAVVCPTDAHEQGDHFFKNPCGTGPYQLAHWKRNESMGLTRFPEYWGTPGNVRDIIFKTVPENSSRTFELMAGELDIADGIAPTDVKMFKENKKYQVLEAPGVNIAHLIMNLDHEPFNDPLVRQAINHAIDPRPIAESLCEGQAEVAQSTLPRGSFGANSDVTRYPHDLDLARDLLAQAGYPDGFKTTLWYPPGARPYLPVPDKIAQVLQADLAKIGIEATLITYEWGTFLAKIREKGEHDLLLLGWQSDNGDPDNTLYTLFDKSSATSSGFNLSRYRGDEVHDLLVQGRSTSDLTTRESIYQEVEQILHDEAVTVPLTHTNVSVVTSNRIQGFQPHPTSQVHLRTTSKTKR